jgi:hypothetical protein
MARRDYQDLKWSLNLGHEVRDTFAEMQICPNADRHAVQARPDLPNTSTPPLRTLRETRHRGGTFRRPGQLCGVVGVERKEIQMATEQHVVPGQRYWGVRVSRMRGDDRARSREPETERRAGHDDLPQRASLFCADRGATALRVGRTINATPFFSPRPRDRRG